MSDNKQPASTAADAEDEVQPTAKSAEDRKAAAALATLDTRDDESSSAREVDQNAINKAMTHFAAGGGQQAGEVKKVKVDGADINLLMDELEVSRPKATELLKQSDGDAVQAMLAYIDVKP